MKTLNAHIKNLEKIKNKKIKKYDKEIQQKYIIGYIDNNYSAIEICYEIFGEGYPIILIQGFGARKENFKYQVPALSEYFKVITFDNRGSGKSERVNDPYTMETLVDDVKRLLDYL